MKGKLKEMEGAAAFDSATPYLLPLHTRLHPSEESRLFTLGFVYFFLPTHHPVKEFYIYLCPISHLKVVGGTR